MDFNNGTNAIVDDIDFLCQTNTTSYPLSAKTRNINRWAWKAHVAQIKGSHRWQIDDTNLTTIPHLKADLVDGQADYTLPSGFLRVERVEIMDSNGYYKLLIPIDQADIKEAYTEFEDTDGEPKYFDVTGNILILKPTPDSSDVTLTNGLRVHILRGIDLFTTSDTTQNPGFPEPFHRAVVYGACYDYHLKVKDYEAAQSFRNEAENELRELTKFIAQMNAAEHNRIRPAHRTVQYL